MARNILFYRTLDRKMRDELGCSIDEFHAAYSVENEAFDLKCNVEEEQGIRYISIVDDTGKWSPDNYNLSLKGKISIKKADSLFGENGVTPDGCTAGIGMVWKSKTSNYRGSMSLGEVDPGVEEQTFDFDLKFAEAAVRGTIELSFQIYLKSSEGNIGLPVGVSLGDVYHAVIILEGIDSSFTVFEKNAPGEPLWTVTCDWDDPEYDSFSENVRVVINTAHPAWALTADEEVRKELLKEIMASSMQIVIAELRDENLDATEEYTPGSVCDAISYLKTRGKIDTESTSTIASSIRSYLDRSMK